MGGGEEKRTGPVSIRQRVNIMSKEGGKKISEIIAVAGSKQRVSTNFRPFRRGGIKKEKRGETQYRENKTKGKREIQIWERTRD